MKLIVGLGNPGLCYKNTKHNAGYWVIDKVAKNLKASFNKRKFNARWATGREHNNTFIIAKPLTFMNLSGCSVQGFVDYYKISLENILIVYDDINLKLGTIRLKPKGGAGGHNGMKSVIEVLGTNDFSRLRFGIGNQTGHRDLSKYVLSSFKGKEDVSLRDEAVNSAVEAVLNWFENDINFAMNKHNEKRREISNHE